MKHKSWLGAVAIASVLLSGCAASTSASPEKPAAPSSSASSSADESHAGESHGGESHTMADGTVMSGAEHGAGHGAKHGTGESAEKSAEVAAREPSDAARMICNGQVVKSVTSFFDLEEAPVPSSTWDQPMFTCTYDLESGPLVLTVHDATDPEKGKAYYESLRKSLGSPEEFKGMLGLGRPGFATGDGTVVFITDGKTLEVDATALSGKMGVNGTSTPSDAAYAVASAVVACWIDHA